MLQRHCNSYFRTTNNRNMSVPLFAWVSSQMHPSSLATSFSLSASLPLRHSHFPLTPHQITGAFSFCRLLLASTPSPLPTLPSLASLPSLLLPQLSTQHDRKIVKSLVSLFEFLLCLLGIQVVILDRRNKVIPAFKKITGPEMLASLVHTAFYCVSTDN